MGSVPKKNGVASCTHRILFAAVQAVRWTRGWGVHLNRATELAGSRGLPLDPGVRPLSQTPSWVYMSESED